MNLMGKILVVSIFVMSLMFMAFSMVIFATHTNWRDRVLDPATGLKKQLADAKSENQALQNTLAQRVAELQTARLIALQSRAKLENEAVALRTDRTELDAENKQLQAARAEATAGFNTAQTNLTALRAEVEKLREEIRAAQQAENSAFADATAKNQQLLEAMSRLQILEARQQELVQTVAEYRARMGSPTSGSVPQITGQVAAMNQNRLEVSIGSDDGLEVGHQLDVFRGTTYLGRVRVEAIEPDRAVASIIPSYQRGSIQRGDRVITVREST